MSDGGWFVSGDEPTPVALGECLCPGTPHPDGDTVWLRPELDVGSGFAVTVAMTGESDGLTERLGRAYLEAGISSWTFLDGAGQPVPCTRANIRRMRWNGSTYRLADMAADLYGSAVLDPLVARSRLILANGSSPNGQTPALTSASRTGSGPRRKR